MTLASNTATIRLHGVELAWTEMGEMGQEQSGAPALVLCHGYTGSSHDFALVTPALAAERRVVALDQRGHGRSTRLGTLEGYSIDHLVADLVAFIEAVGRGPVDLLGHSMGGRVVMGVTLERPDLVRSLVLMDTSAWSFLVDDDALRALAQGFIESFDPAAGMPPTLTLGSPEDTLIEQRTPAEWRAEKDGLFAGMDPFAVKAFGMTLFHDDGETSIRPRLASITCPTTVIAGEHDHPMVDQAVQLAAEAGGGRVSLIEGAYHSPQLTHPDEWLAAVETHLEWANEERPGT
jgi:pimeloyl-ACP methyl ester carboxylesterase